MARLRVFVAIALPGDLQRSLQTTARSLAAVIPGVAWVSAANLHMTLKFLGDVDEQVLGPIVTSLGAAAAQVEAFELSIGELGAFPSVSRPRVIWVGASGDRLDGLVESIESGLQALGFPRETRPFSAHITLGRVRPGRDRRSPQYPSHAADDRGGPRVSRGGPSAGGTWGAISGPSMLTAALSGPPVLIDRIVLMQSQLSPRGASYAELAAFPLAPPR